MLRGALAGLTGAALLHPDGRSKIAATYLAGTIPGNEYLNTKEQKIVLSSVAKHGFDLHAMKDVLLQGSDGRKAAVKITAGLMSNSMMLWAGDVDPSLALSETEAKKVIEASEKYIPYLEPPLRNKVVELGKIAAARAAEEVRSSVNTFSGESPEPSLSSQELLKSTAMTFEKELDRQSATIRLRDLEKGNDFKPFDLGSIIAFRHHDAEGEINPYYLH